MTTKLGEWFLNTNVLSPSKFAQSYYFLLLKKHPKTYGTSPFKIPIYTCLQAMISTETRRVEIPEQSYVKIEALLNFNSYHP